MTSSIEYDIVSADSHVLEPRGLFQPRVAVNFRERVPKLAPWNGGDAWHIEGLDPVPLPITAATGSGYRLGRGSSKTPMAFHDVLPGLYEPVSRLEAQAANSIDAEVLYPSPTLWDAINQMDDRKLKVACVRAYNDWIAEFCAQDPRRLIGLGKIPSTGREDACKELHRCVEELNLRGVVLDGWPSGKQIAGDSDDDVFWEAIDGLGVPVSLHYAVGGQRPSHPYGGIGPGLKPPMADAACRWSPAACSTASRTSASCSRTAMPDGCSTGLSSWISTTFAIATWINTLCRTPMRCRASMCVNTPGLPSTTIVRR